MHRISMPDRFLLLFVLVAIGGSTCLALFFIKTLTPPPHPWIELFVLIVSLGGEVCALLLKRHNLRHFPDISDSKFLRMFKNNFSVPDESDEAIIYEKRYIAKHIGIPCQKISPNHTFDEISNCTNFFGDFDLAIGDLEDEISELFESTDTNKPYSIPNTIGELIYEIVEAKRGNRKRNKEGTKGERAEKGG